MTLQLKLFSATPLKWNFNGVVTLKYDTQDLQGKAAFQHDPATRTSGKEPMRTPNKNMTGRKAKHGQDYHFNDTLKEIIVTNKEI
jgi:hypothetical protein